MLRAADRHRRPDGDRQDRTGDRARGGACARGASPRRSSRPTRARCTEASTSGPRRRRPRNGARVVHHGIDLVDPDAPYSVADFRAHALAALEALGDRGGIGILAGGTGFWLRAVASGVDTGALPSDATCGPRSRPSWSGTGPRPPPRRLRAAAPALAARTDLRNPRRVARALEIAALQGDAPLPAAIGYGAPVLGIQLVVEPAELRRRIAARARAQFEAGLVEEARALRERWDPGLPRVLGDRLSRELGLHRRRAHARGRDRARRRPQRPVREAPAHLVPARAGAGRGRRHTDPARCRLSSRLEAFLRAGAVPRYAWAPMSPASPDRPRPARREGVPRGRRHRRRRRLERRGQPHRARRARRDGGRRRRGRRVAEPPPRRPQLVRGQGQGRRAAPGEVARPGSTSSSPTTSSARPSRRASSRCSTSRSSTGAG